MSNRRKMRPHELARKDQTMAAMDQIAADGGLAVVADEPEPGTQCTWCDCPDWRSPDSPHARPGYVCPFPCPAGAVFSVRMTSSQWGEQPQPVPLCLRHHGDWLDDFAANVLDPAGRLEILPAWMDDDYEAPLIRHARSGRLASSRLCGQSPRVG